ncbi:3304_t:CDS:2 [Paraglomus brasilianum]|uniref:Mediator of RNA polymerase II transcription subunit 25 n=1 Tax=Paraglomus brasilianum TaxID=144538 RepID=A0A9N9F6I9_9GLOM|nr:3304_t:CDS:2 [Paraglomus brasilianum]
MPISRSSSHVLPEVLVVFVIDGSWRMNKHFRSVCEKILHPIIQKLKSPKVIDLEDKQNKDRVTPALRYGLVIFRDFHSINIVESRHFNADLNDFYMQLDSLVFCQGGFENAIAEGLIAAVEMFDTHKQQIHSELIEPEKHCILVTNSNPLMDDAVHHNEDERYDEYNMTDICEEMARQNIHLSLVVPDRELKLVNLDNIVRTVNKEKEVIDLSQEFDVGMLRLSDIEIEPVNNEPTSPTMTTQQDIKRPRTEDASDQANVDAPQTKKIKTEKTASTDNQNINKSTHIPSPSPSQHTIVQPTPRLGTQQQPQIQRDTNANIISINTPRHNGTSPGSQIGPRRTGTPVRPNPVAHPNSTATPVTSSHLTARPNSMPNPHRLWSSPEAVAQLTPQQVQQVQVWKSLPHSVYPNRNLQQHQQQLAAAFRNQLIHANNAGSSTGTGITTSPAQVANAINIANGLVGLQTTPKSQNSTTPTQGSVQRTHQTPSTVSANLTSQMNISNAQGPHNGVLSGMTQQPSLPQVPPRPSKAPVVWNGQIAWQANQPGTPHRQELSCDIFALAIPSNAPNNISLDKYQVNLWPNKMVITGVTSTKDLGHSSESQSYVLLCANTQSGPNASQNKERFEILKRSLEKRNIVGQIRFPNSPIQNTGMAIFVNKDNLFGKLYLDSPMPRKLVNIQPGQQQPTRPNTSQQAQPPSQQVAQQTSQQAQQPSQQQAQQSPQQPQVKLQSPSQIRTPHQMHAVPMQTAQLQTTQMQMQLQALQMRGTPPTQASQMLQLKAQLQQAQMRPQQLQALQAQLRTQQMQTAQAQAPRMQSQQSQQSQIQTSQGQSTPQHAQLGLQRTPQQMGTPPQSRAQGQTQIQSRPVLRPPLQAQQTPAQPVGQPQVTQQYHRQMQLNQMNQQSAPANPQSIQLQRLIQQLARSRGIPDAQPNTSIRMSQQLLHQGLSLQALSNGQGHGNIRVMPTNTELIQLLRNQQQNQQPQPPA